MKIFKRILSYLCWTLIALGCAYIYMSIILGPQPEPTDEFFSKMNNTVYEIVLIQVGFIIGIIIAVAFILVDLLYLNKKLKNATYAFAIRLAAMVGISIFIGVTHYMLEKVIDVI